MKLIIIILLFNNILISFKIRVVTSRILSLTSMFRSTSCSMMIIMFLNPFILMLIKIYWLLKMFLLYDISAHYCSCRWTIIIWKLLFVLNLLLRLREIWMFADKIIIVIPSAKGTHLLIIHSIVYFSWATTCTLFHT